MQGRLYIKTTQIPLFLLYSSIPIHLFHIYPTILSRFFTLAEKILRSADRRLFVLYIFLNLRVYQRSSVFWFWSLLKNILRKESKLKTMKRRNASDDGERGNKKLGEQAVCELSSSQESSSTQSAKEILRRRLNRSGCNKMKSVFLDRKIMLLFRIGLRSCQILVIFVKCGR